MGQHYTTRTLSASAHCNRCGKMTQHRVDKGRMGPCIPCMDRAAQESAARREPPAVQEQLFRRMTGQAETK